MTKTKKQTKRRKGQSASKAIVIRKDYIRRLIAGVRWAIEKAPENIEAGKIAGKGAITGNWLDAALLCDVVEKEIVKNKSVYAAVKPRRHGD